MNNVNVPSIAWAIFSLGLSVFMVCMGLASVSKDSISLEVAESKFKASKALNQVRNASDEVKDTLSQLEVREAKYDDLLKKYSELSNKYKALKLLQPEIEEIESSPKIEVNSIDKKLQEANKNISEELDNLY